MTLRAHGLREYLVLSLFLPVSAVHLSDSNVREGNVPNSHSRLEQPPSLRKCQCASFAELNARRWTYRLDCFVKPRALNDRFPRSLDKGVQVYLCLLTTPHPLRRDKSISVVYLEHTALARELVRDT